MYYTHLLRVLLVTLSATTVAQATWLENGRIPDGALVKRQGTSVTADDDPTTTPSPSRTPTPTPTSTPGGDDNNNDSNTPTPSKTASTTSKPTETKSTTSDDGSKPTNTSEEPEDPITETFTEIITTTNSNGEPSSFTSEGTVTRTPGLSQGSGGASGMTKGTRNIVIGVVVGVGGAIVLGALGFVAWRIWGRKKQAEEHDNLMNYGDKPDERSSAGGTATGPARNPFQSTLETYHAPTQVNASSNF